MINNIELTDEQLAAVAGGLGDTNVAVSLPTIVNPSTQIAALNAGGVSQTSGNNSINNSGAGALDLNSIHFNKSFNQF